MELLATLGIGILGLLVLWILSALLFFLFDYVDTKLPMLGPSLMGLVYLSIFAYLTGNIIQSILK